MECHAVTRSPRAARRREREQARRRPRPARPETPGPVRAALVRDVRRGPVRVVQDRRGRGLQLRDAAVLHDRRAGRRPQRLPQPGAPGPYAAVVRRQPGRVHRVPRPGDEHDGHVRGGQRGTAAPHDQKRDPVDPACGALPRPRGAGSERGGGTLRRSRTGRLDGAVVRPVLLPPAGLPDMVGQHDAWVDYLGRQFKQEIRYIRERYHPAGAPIDGVVPVQFVDLTDEAVPDGAVLQAVTWSGFPRKLLIQERDGDVVAYAAAEHARTTQSMLYTADGEPFELSYRNGDEYLEWRAERDDRGRLRRITFTCEPPDYWSVVAQGYPSPFFMLPGNQTPKRRRNAGRMDRVLARYREVVSPDVQPEDLVFAQDMYDRDRSWPERARPERARPRIARPRRRVTRSRPGSGSCCRRSANTSSTRTTRLVRDPPRTGRSLRR